MPLQSASLPESKTSFKTLTGGLGGINTGTDYLLAAVEWRLSSAGPSP